MKKRLPLVALVAAFAAPVWANPQTVTLSVSGMTCSACPLTVKKALNKVPGVSKAAVNFEKKEAVVTFDDAMTNPHALTKATEEAGFPSTAKQ